MLGVLFEMPPFCIDSSHDVGGATTSLVPGSHLIGAWRWRAKQQREPYVVSVQCDDLFGVRSAEHSSTWQQSTVKDASALFNCYASYKLHSI